MSTRITHLSRARLELHFLSPFFGAFASGLALEESLEIDTAATDGVRILVNPIWAHTLTVTRLAAVLAHECAHVILGHCHRRGDRDPETWNIACDHAINLDLLADGRFPLPAYALADRAYVGLSAEHIYARLTPQPGDQPGDQPGSQPGVRPAFTPGRVLDAPQDAPSLAGRVLDAARQSSVFRTLRGCEQRVVDRLTDPPPVDWRAALAAWVSRTLSPDPSWSRPDRRHAQRGVYLPSRCRPGVGVLVLVVDTSGSIDTDALRMFASATEDALTACSPAGVWVLAADTQVRSATYCAPGDPLPWHDLPGGGGTDFSPALQWVADLPEPPVGVIYLTDLEGQTSRLPDPGVPLLWACSTGLAAPAGHDVIRLAPWLAP